MILQQIADNLHNSAGTALVINDTAYSYRELRELVQSYYCVLQQLPGNSLIGIVMHNDLPTYAMIVATVLSDCGYVILNPAFPRDRIALICSEAKLSIVFGSQASDAHLLPDKHEFIDLCGIPANAARVMFLPPRPDSPAYVLFTSGTSGKPKGVLITKSNLEALLRSLSEIPLPIDCDDRVLQMFDLSFDGSVLMLFMPLAAGASVYTVDPQKIKYLEVARLMLSYRLSFVFVVPSVIALLKPFLASLMLPDIKTFIVGAEAVAHSRIQSILPCIPNATLWNLYGPTEGTVCVTAYQMDENVINELHNDLIPIGKPMPGVRHLIVYNGTLVTEAQVKGELYIGGDQLCGGYLNDPKQDESSFFTMNYEGRAERFYATGDIVFRNQWGNYMYCGRKDRQVKVQGNRIELAEIEFHARSIAKTEVVAVVKDTGDRQSLHLFVEDHQGPDEAIVEYLDTQLPACMIPKRVINLKHLPRNDHDKIDIQQLHKMIEKGEQDG